VRWQFGRRSSNVEDRRGGGVAGPVVGGGIGAIILAIMIALLGGDPTVILQQAQSDSSSSSNQAQNRAGQDQVAEFVAVVLADTEDVWNEQFQRMGRTYREPKLVLFEDAVQSACGFAQAAMGPFYCPRDEKVYLDLGFFRELKQRHQAPGDFAQAYVIAHEVGHHVQNQLGIAGKVSTLQQRVGQAEANQLSVRLELQADCLAGVWANQAERSRQILEQGDIEEALNAASQIGDDTLQSKAKGYVVPDAFTHGSSAQRVRWFKQGIQSGDMRQCDTFSANQV